MIDQDKKFCPMKAGGQNAYAQTPLCEKDQCAWWCRWSECCAMVAIPAELSDRMHDLMVSMEGK